MGFRPYLVNGLAGGEHDGGSAVVDAGGVAGGDALDVPLSGRHPGMPVGSKVWTTSGFGGLGADGERAAQLGDALRGGRRRLGYSSFANGNHLLLDLDHHGDDLVIEPAGGLRGLGLLLGGGGEGVLLARG